MTNNCRKCGRFIGKTDSLLCEGCYRAFMKWSSKRFLYLAKKERNALEIWLEKGESLL